MRGPSFGKSYLGPSAPQSSMMTLGWYMLSHGKLDRMLLDQALRSVAYRRPTRVVCVAFLGFRNDQVSAGTLHMAECVSLQCDDTRVACVTFPMVDHGNLDRILLAQDGTRSCTGASLGWYA